MESAPTSPANKRHAVFFRRRSPSHDIITAQFPNPKSGHITSSNVSIANYHTPATLEDALALSESPPPQPSHHSKNPSRSRHPLERSQSSEYYLEIRKSPAPSEPQSRKINYNTIHTDATETQPAFQSDAFAIQMPTTREPIIDRPVYRAKLPSPSRAQIDAYQTYKQKANEVREANKSEGVRVPSKIVSYDYACAAKNGQPRCSELCLSPPESPPQLSPAGSFPLSPPVPQQTWPRPKQQVSVRGPRSMSDSSNLSIARKPVGLGNISSRPHIRYQRGDADTGATHSTLSPAPTPTKIRVRLKPKPGVVDADPPQKESWWGLYNRSPANSSNDGSRSPSPTKLHFAYTSPDAADTVFGHNSNDITGTLAAARSKPKKTLPQTPPKRSLTSRWAWLRPSGPRIAKPTTTPPRFPVAAAAKASTPAYIDPFVLHATPVPTHTNTPSTSRPASPRKLARPAPAPTEKGKFETGFAQVTSLGGLILKVCLLIYVLVGLYFLLDAIREAVHALGAPFRGIKLVAAYVWVGGAWTARVLCKGWERWGVKIALKGGWRGRWW